MLLLVLLPDYVGIQGLSFLLILTPGFCVTFYFQKSLHWLQSQLAVIWFCRQDCSTVGGKLGQIATRLKQTLFWSETIRNQPGKPNKMEQQTIRPTLTLTGHFMKVSGRNHSLTRRIGLGFTIKGLKVTSVQLRWPFGVSASWDGCIRVWSLTGATCIRSF